ncbi:hypothetical protein BKA70DRAFT_1400703 [Coprinopsis sp. MPI-PUGE-AT-0042]|nr:hypothetical protein BKA70DRAFT_1400703 [Coprinopsis sp. MPI-PUGE-AT-0042]
MGASFSKWARWEDPGLQAMSIVSGAGAPQATGPSVFQGSKDFTINGGNFCVTNVSANDDARLERLLDFLSEVNFRAIHLENLGKWAPGTVKWFLESDIFRHWLLSQWDIIWGTGMPGAGKTILASMVIDYLNSLADASSDICVAFIYCRYTEPMTVRDILAAVVRQLLERYPQLLPLVEPTCAKHQLQKTKPTQKELIGLIRDICAIFRVAYISIDGLDEALPDEQFDLLDTLTSIKANFIITSRPLHILKEVLPSTAKFFDIIAREEDVELLVAQRIERSPELRRLLGDDEKRREVITKVCKASQGMFLHATLLIENIRYCTSVKKIMERLGQLPAGLDALYAETQPSEQPLPSECFSGLFTAQERLFIEDMAYAVAEDPENDWLDPSSLVDESLLTSTGSQTTDKDTVTRAPRLIRQLSIYRTYAGHNSFANQTTLRGIPCNGSSIPRHASHGSLHAVFQIWAILRVLPIPLPSTAVILYLEKFFPSHCCVMPYQQWAFHALEAIDGTTCRHSRPMPLILRLFEMSKDFPVEVLLSTGVGVIATVTSNRLFTSSLIMDYHVNEQTSHGRTALMLAVEAGNVTMVEALLSLDGIDPNLADSECNTPLHLAALKGTLAALRQLLRHPKFSPNLSIAAQLLDAPGIDPNFGNDEGLTAFMAAARRGAIPILDFLAKHPATDINAKDHSGCTAFLHACRGAGGDALHWFMGLPGADLAAKDHQGRNALMLRAGAPIYIPVDAILADFTALIGGGAGLELNEQDIEGQTALFHALKFPGRKAFEALVQLEGLDFIHRDHRGRTPLMVAHDAWSISHLLAHPDTDVNARDNEGETAVLAASSGASSDALRALLASSDVDANARDARGLSAVERALMAAALQTAFRILAIHTSYLKPIRHECQDGRRMLVVPSGLLELRLYQVPGILVYLEPAPTTNGQAIETPPCIVAKFDKPTEAGSTGKESPAMIIPDDGLYHNQVDWETLGAPCLNFPWDCGWIADECDGALQLLLNHPAFGECDYGSYAVHPLATCQYLACMNQASPAQIHE